MVFVITQDLLISNASINKLQKGGKWYKHEWQLNLNANKMVFKVHSLLTLNMPRAEYILVGRQLYIGIIKLYKEK